MKCYKWILLTLTVATLTILGCSKQSSVDTGSLQSSFKSAEPAAQTSVDKAVAAIKAADYPGALAELKTLAGNAKLTPEQQQAVKDVVAQVEKVISEAAANVKGEATKAVDDLKKSLPK